MNESLKKKALLQRIADGIDFSFTVPDAEKDIAEEAIIRFEATLKRADDADEHLEILAVPLRRHESISTKSLVNKRGLLNRFKQKVKFNYNEVKAVALLAIRKLDYFTSGDVNIQEIITSFIESIEELEDYVHELLDALSDYESSSFKEDVLSCIDKIHAHTKKLDTLISDRVIDHIDTNILAKNWMSDTSNEINVELEDRVPLVSELAEEREKALHPENFPGNAQETQSLNPSDAQRVYYPNKNQQTGIEGYNLETFLT